jgi:hypothetical protein
VLIDFLAPHAGNHVQLEFPKRATLQAYEYF